MILSALQSGPKRYGELPQSPSLDYQLRSLLKQGVIVRYTCQDMTTRYKLFSRDSEDQVFCTGCGVVIDDPVFKRCYKCRQAYNLLRRSRGKHACVMCGKKTHNHKYCSLTCRGNGKPVTIPCYPPCKACGKMVKRRENKYCSTACARRR